MADSQTPAASFTRLWVTAQPLVTSYVFAAIRQSHDAEDLLQEVAAAALDDFASYDDDRPFTPWVLGIARHRILNYYRRMKSDKLQFNDMALSALADAHGQLQEQSSMRRQALNECLKRVEGKKLEALRLRYTQDVPVQDIATMLSTSANAVSVLLYKVRKSLFHCVERTLSSEAAR